jgi:FtsZ-interacting cell division protein ZipA
MFIVGKDVISKGAMIYGMMSEMKANMSYLKDIHAELKKKNMPQPTIFQQQVQQAPQQQYEQQVSQPISKPEPVYQQVQNDPVYSQPAQPVKQAPVQQPIESFVDEFQSNVSIPNPPKIGRKAKEMQKAVQKTKKQVNLPVEKKPTKIQHKKSNIEDLGREYKEVGE